MAKDLIPVSTIGILATVLIERYTATELRNFFDIASAPNIVRWDNKSNLIRNKLKAINYHHDRPLDSLGLVIQDFMDTDVRYESDEYLAVLSADRKKVTDSLASAGYFYSTGGKIRKGHVTPALSFLDQVRNDSLSAVQKELDRALKSIDSDPRAALHFACNALEATLKVYLERRQIEYNHQKDTLKILWDKFVANQGLSPKASINPAHKELVSGLYKIVSGTMTLRNKDSSAHGRTSQEINEKVISPLHARLAVNSISTIAGYVLECT